MAAVIIVCGELNSKIDNEKNEISYCDKCVRVEKIKTPSKWRIKNIPKRYIITILIFVANIVKGYFHTNVSLVIADITSDRKIIHNNVTQIIEAEVAWTSTEISFIFGANAIGQILSLFTGTMVHKIGGATYFGVGMMGEAISSIFSPFTISTHVYLFSANRLILGFFEGLSFTGAIDVFTHWAPRNERVRLITFSDMGLILGVATNYPLSGFIIQNFGWQNLFLFSGIIIFIWCLPWFVFVSNDPSTDRFISEEERAYLTKEINYISKDKIQIPYKSILKSIPVNAFINEIFVSSLIISFFLMIPLFVKDVYHTNIQTVGLISGIPEICAVIIMPFVGYFGDYCRSKGYDIGKLHKLFLFWGQSLTLVFFFICGIWNNVNGCVLCITLGRTAFTLSGISYAVLPIDIAGQYAGFLQSVKVTVRNIAYIINPLLVSWMVRNHTQSEWNLYFLFLSFITMYGVIVFAIFGSGDLQPWAMATEKKTDNEATVP